MSRPSNQPALLAVSDATGGVGDRVTRRLTNRLTDLQRNLRLIVLTNSDGGPRLLGELFIDDWALRRFAGVSNLPARPSTLSKRKLALYEGLYTGQTIDPPGTKPGDKVTQTTRVELKANDNGRLRMTLRMVAGPDVLLAPSDLVGAEDATAAVFTLAFYREDYVLVLDESGEPFVRANFVRGHNERVEWLRFGGRLFRHQGA